MTSLASTTVDWIRNRSAGSPQAIFVEEGEHSYPMQKTVHRQLEGVPVVSSCSSLFRSDPEKLACRYPVACR